MAHGKQAILMTGPHGGTLRQTDCADHRHNHAFLVACPSRHAAGHVATMQRPAHVRRQYDGALARMRLGTLHRKQSCGRCDHRGPAYEDAIDT